MQRFLTKFRFSTIQAQAKHSDPAKLSYYFTEATTEEGKTNNIIFLHGFLGSQTNFRSVAKYPQIQKQANSYMIDQRNHGRSEHKATMTTPEMAYDLKHFILNENIKDNIFLIGHSMGGRVAMEFISQYPEFHDQVKGAIMVDILPVNYMKEKNPTIMQTYIMVNQLASMDFKGRSLQSIKEEVKIICDNDVIANFISMQIAEKNDEFVTESKYHWRCNFSAFRDNYVQMISHETQPCHYDGKLHFICGDRSTYANPKRAQESISKVFNNFDAENGMEFFENTSHFVHAEKPIQFRERVADILEKWI